jgi:plastocyanin
MPRRRLALALCACAAAGCASTATVGGGRVLHLGVTEYRLKPDSVRMSAGVLTIVVHNYGRLTHNLAVSSAGQTEASTKPLWPGQSASLTLNLAPGHYQLASTLLSDQALGAYGTLTVTR